MKRYKLIANPAAGRGRSREAVLRSEEAFRKRGARFDLELTRAPGQAASIARRSLAEFDVIVAVGGDGTVNEVLPSVAGMGRPLGIIPTGSGNDFIKPLGIPNSIEQAVAIVFAGGTKLIDLGRINGRYFANGVGIGFDAAVNRASYGIGHSRGGLWLYVYALVRTLGRFDSVAVTVSINGTTARQELFFLTVGNGTTVGGGFRLTPHARMDDGLLDVTMVRPLAVPTLLWHLPKVFRGTIDRAKRYARLERATRVRVESDGPLPVHVDGEIFETDGRPLEIDIVPSALTVICGNPC
jgi:diacylglycerol kinase (ATP)